MSTFNYVTHSIGGYVGSMPNNTNKFNDSYDVGWFGEYGGAQLTGVTNYAIYCRSTASSAPTDWLNSVTTGSSFTPLVVIPLTASSEVVPYSVVLGCSSGGAIGLWLCNSITPQIPIQLKFTGYKSYNTFEKNYISVGNPLAVNTSVKYDTWYDGTTLGVFAITNNSTWYTYTNPTKYGYRPVCIWTVNLPALFDMLQYEVNVFGSLGVNGLYGEVFSPDYGTPSTEEGYGVGGQYGTFDDSSDTISLPTAPAVGMTSTGFVNVYEISQNALTQFGSELFPDLSFTPVSQLPAPTDVTTALENIATVLTDFGNQIPNMIDMYINNTLINYILDCHILPVAPQTSGTSNIKVGFRTFTPLVNVVTSDYVDFDCGSLNIGEYYGNFIDYAPYTTAKLFLPFVGFVEVLPEFWQAGTLSITYRFNIIDGSFMVFIKSTSSKSKLSDTVIAQYGGNVCVHIPITGANYSNMITGLVGAVGGVATHGAGASSIVGGMASALNTVATQSGMQSSNSYNSSTAFLGIRTPYLLIERTVADFSETYDSERGLPSNISTSFSSLSGFTSSSTVHLDGITGATAEELDELSALLAGGVIL